MSAATELAGGEIAALEARFADASPEAVLEWVLDRFDERAVLASSLGLEDVVLLHLSAGLFARTGRRFRIVMLDTGRLPPETYALLDRLEARYGLGIEVFFPQAPLVESLVRKHGINGFYGSVDARHACCAARKLEPMRRALQDVSAWITGLRREQAVSRTELHPVAWEDGRFKLSPLAGWSTEQVWQFVREHRVPYNPLHDQGYPSIGCSPCTRAIEPGEDLRAGRWWWERADHRECGLHARRR